MEAGIEARYHLAHVWPKKVVDGDSDFRSVSSKGAVPVLVLDNSDRLTESAAVLQYIADLKLELGLAPPPGHPDRYRLQEWRFTAADAHLTWTLLLLRAAGVDVAQWPQLADYLRGCRPGHRSRPRSGSRRPCARRSERERTSSLSSQRRGRISRRHRHFCKPRDGLSAQFSRIFLAQPYAEKRIVRCPRYPRYTQYARKHTLV
jgi:hypothetical protein